MAATSRRRITDLRFCCAANVVTASEAREPDAYRDSSNRLLGRTVLARPPRLFGQHVTLFGHTTGL